MSVVSIDEAVFNAGEATTKLNLIQTLMKMEMIHWSIVMTFISPYML